MGKVVVFNHLTLDGVMQSPSGPDEDARDGFQHGGWAAANMDPELSEAAAAGAGQQSPLLFGRRTYEQFAGFWPHQSEDDNPFVSVLNNSRKYVASRTMEEPLPWVNSTLLKGEATEAVARLKAELDEDLVILGSGELIRSLMQRNLIDRFILLIHPLVLGSGCRLFADDGAYAKLQLADAKPTSTGVLIATYELAEQPAETTDRLKAVHQT